MSDDRDARVRARAYERWEQAGRPDGEDLKHWLDAERELDGGGDDEARAGISNRPPGEEWTRQHELPPRMERKTEERHGERGTP
jgi:hypothetical protein